MEDNEEKKIIIFPYKDAPLNKLLEPDDYLEWLDNPKLKEEIDKCLNEHLSEK